MLDHIKSETPDERFVFQWREARVIERIAVVLPMASPCRGPVLNINTVPAEAWSANIGNIRRSSS